MFRRGRSADDFAEEIKSHFELEADELQSEGLSEEEAYRRARVEFGSSQAAQERFYLSSRIVWFDNLLHDIKFAIRQLIRNPSFTFVAIVTLALGIAANSTLRVGQPAIARAKPPCVHLQHRENPCAHSLLPLHSPRQ